MSTKISVIIPVYNAEKYLEKCLDSVINQSLEDIEIICINDCSTDNTKAILNRYKSKYSNIQVITFKENKGESSARNAGVKKALGEYLAFVDNDDTIETQFYEKLYKKAKKTGADITKGNVKEIKYDGTEIYGNLNQKIRKHRHNKLFFVYHWWTAIYKKALISKHNIHFPDGFPLGGDIFFLNKAIINANKVALVDKAYYHYHRREDSGFSKTLTTQKISSLLSIYKTIVKNINKEKISSRNKGLQFIFYTLITHCLNLTWKTDNEKAKEDIALTLFSIFTDCPEPLQKNKTLLSDYQCIYDALIKKDINLIINILKKHKNYNSFVAYNLRYKIQNKEKQ